jgi:hypothetical protein
MNNPRFFEVLDRLDVLMRQAPGTALDEFVETIESSDVALGYALTQHTESRTYDARLSRSCSAYRGQTTVTFTDTYRKPYWTCQPIFRRSGPGERRHGSARVT